MPNTDTTGTIARSVADTNYTAFQPVNNTATQIAFIGNIFFGIQGFYVAKFTGHGIPRGAIIDTADIDVVAAQTTAGAVSFTLASPSLSDSPAWRPDSFGPAWRPELWGRFKVNVRDTGAASIINTVPGVPTTNWALRFVSPKREILAQSFIVPAGPDPTLGDCLMNLSRVGSPSGNLTLEIQGVDADGLPDGNVLATSDPVLATSVPLAQSDVLFDFTGANEITLTAGVTYFVVLNGTYTPDSTNYINWFELRQFFSIGGARHYGTGNDWDDQNYPGQADVFIEAQSAGPGDPVPWVPPPFTAGVTYTTPSLADLIQSIVNDVDYTSRDPISIAFRSAGSTSTRRIATFDHPTFASPILNVSYRPRRMSVL